MDFEFDVGDIVFHIEYPTIPRIILARIYFLGKNHYIIDGYNGSGIAKYTKLDSRILESWINYNYNDSEFVGNIYDYVGKPVMWIYPHKLFQKS